MTNSSPFALAACQPGMERALKAELAKLRPDLHPGFQRPGLVTFSATAKPFGPGDAPPAIFARMWAASAGPCATLDAVVLTAQDVGATHLFCGTRDPGDDAPPGVLHACAHEATRWEKRLAPNFTAGPPKRGDVVLDVFTAPNEDPVVGWHIHSSGRHERPGGRFDYVVPEDLPSRTWCKVVEGLRWSHAPLAKGDLVLELGAAPGGGTRAFVEAGARVLAVDSMPIDPAVAAMPGVTVVAKRIGDLRLEWLPPDVRWLACDAGIPPEDVLRAIERLRPALPNLRGFLLLLKLSDEGVIRHLPLTFEKLKQLGATAVNARQLPANRRDIFVYAPITPRSATKPATAKRTGRRPGERADRPKPAKQAKKPKSSSAGGSRR